MRRLALLLLLAPPAGADTLVATRTIRPFQLIAPGDLTLDGGSYSGGTDDASSLIGLEARVAIYAGRPVRAADVGPPTIVERNQLVSLIYDGSGLRIATEGRALDRASEGDLIRVMNLSSRNTVTARIGTDGSAYVSE
ncbi:flagellar basal body P-ring formation chaperone FlgA [Pelagovum pacificum]|uniref:Flagella basal body P-ring formation protein FlgA n=1 Tax=Pelagovum pacificum TaxID=2588711 RepID=A0A5C5GK95_9RHOB|nr:flagellar basal body P-ring formation chaperone FlgA [Pelagovum pacificum]QQA42979.1 flagellar basal body P-ring formation protein FlgA [Pelagovum pacificum]TNY33876.1 flagellar basal body P-ring formation protein FlgA [Pelagovum pacificum]